MEVVGDASSALGITDVFAPSVSVFFFLLRCLRQRRNTTIAMMRRKTSNPPAAPPITAPEAPLELGVAVGGDVVLGELLGVLPTVEEVVGSGTLDDSATFRS